MAFRKWMMLLLVLSCFSTFSVSQLGVPGMEYVEYLRTAPRKSSINREASVSKRLVPKYRSQDDTGANIYQRRQDVNVEENRYREIMEKKDDTGADIYQRRQDVNMEENRYREIEEKEDDTGADIYQRRQDVNVEEIGYREIEEKNDDNNQDVNKQNNIFLEYDYNTNTQNYVKTISTDYTASVTEIYHEINKVIPQSDLTKLAPENYDNKNYESTESSNIVTNCRGSECYIQPTQASHTQSSVYQNYEDNTSNQNIGAQNTEETKQYVKMVRITPTTRSPVKETLVYQQKPVYTEPSQPSPNYSAYPVGHRSGPYYAPIKEGRYQTGEVYSDKNYAYNQYQTEVYPQNTYPADAYSQNVNSNERYDTANYPTITYPTYDNRYYPNPSYASNYQAGPRPLAQLYYKTKPNPPTEFKPSEQYFPSPTVRPTVHNYQNNFNTAPAPVQQNQHNSNSYSDSSNLRYSKVQPQSQTIGEYNAYKKPSYRAPRYVRPSSIKNYDFNKVSKQVDIEKKVVTTPKPLDPAIVDMLKARAAKEAANRYYTGLQREIERSDLMADAVRAVRSRSHMKSFNITKAPGKVKRSTTSYPVILHTTKTSTILPETQYHEKEIQISENRRVGKSIREVNNNARSKKEISVKSFHHNLPTHPLYRNLPGRANYALSTTTTQSPAIYQKALELKKFQKVKSQFDALVPKASYKPAPFPTHPSYPGQQIHVPRPTTFRPFVVPKYNKYYKPGYYIRPAKVQISRLYKQREYVPKYVRPVSNNRETTEVVRHSPPSSFIDIPKESVKVNPTSSYLQKSKERSIVYHKPQVSPQYVTVRAPKQLASSPEYTAGPRVHSNINTAKREHRQIAKTNVNPQQHFPVTQQTPREYRALLQTQDNKRPYIPETYSNPREHRALIQTTSEIPKINQSYSPKPYNKEVIENPRDRRRSMEVNLDRNVKFPRFGYNIDGYFEDFPSFGFFDDS